MNRFFLASGLVLGFILSSALAQAAPNVRFWSVYETSCGTQLIRTSGVDQFKLVGDTLVHSYTYIPDANRMCVRTETFKRLIRSSADQPDLYTEASTLIPLEQETTCTLKAGGSYTDRLPLKGPNQPISIYLDAKKGNIEFLNGGPSCLTNPLHYILLPE